MVRNEKHKTESNTGKSSMDGNCEPGASHMELPYSDERLGCIENHTTGQ